MKSKINPSARYWAGFNRFELRIPGEAILDIAQSGSNDAAVEYWAPLVRAQNVDNLPTPDKVQAELKEYGAWDAEELADEEANWRRVVWLGAHSIAEDDEPVEILP